MSSRHLALGESGEDMAVRYLSGLGMKIVDRRVRLRHGEIDVVARDGREWVFVEVKTRTSGRMGSASEAFTPRKAGRMRKAVAEYVSRHSLQECPLRCDLVAIDFDDNGKPDIKHYPGGITWK